MKISFEQIQTNHLAEQTNITYGGTNTDKKSVFCGYAVDISGRVMDNNAYGQGKTTEEVMQMIGAQDISVMHDYLTVMSHSMSAEDFHEMQKEGFDPSKMNIEESVTMLDHIKAALLEGGAVIEGFTTKISKDVLQEITGSERLAKTIEQAKSLKAPDEAAKKYMVSNQVPTTIEGFYQANHSASGNGNQQGYGYYADGVQGYYARKAEGVDVEAIAPQLRRVIEDANLPVEEATMEEAAWLVEKGIPLTTGNLTKLHQIQEITFPLSEELIAKAVVSAVEEGLAPGEGNLFDPRTTLEKATDLAKEVQSITKEDIKGVMMAGGALTIAQMRAYAHGPRQISEQEGVVPDVNQLRHAELVLYRTQLMMSAEANRKLMRSGYAIETAPLEELVSRLEALEEQEKKAFWQVESLEEAQQRQHLYEDTWQTLQRMATAPAAAMIPYMHEKENITVAGLEQEAAKLQREYQQANGFYETMRSVPRSDLGDSMKKAFANVDDILMDLALSLHDMNRRAVRILGYNGMDITPEMVAAVKQMDTLVQSIYDRMTPAATLALVRQGINPLTLSLEALANQLGQYQNDHEQSNEQLGKFLFSLEQNKAITQEEKEACIGIYRIFRQIERKDHALVGRLVASGVEPTLKNVVAAMRSEKKKGMDYVVDDAFSGVDAVEKGQSITEQIEGAFYQRIAGRVTNQASADQILDAMNTYQLDSLQKVNEADTTLQQMAATILQDSRYDVDKKEWAKAYEEQQLTELKGSVVLTREALSKVLELSLPTSPAYMKAYEQLMENHQGWHTWMKKQWNQQTTENKMPHDETAAKALVHDFVSALGAGDETQMETTYQALTDVYQDWYQEMEDNATDYLDLRTLQTLHKQLSVATNLHSYGRWDVPMTVLEEDTLVHVTFRQGDGVKGQVDIFFAQETLGSVAARFHVGKANYGQILCESQTAQEMLQGLQETIEGLVGGSVTVNRTTNVSRKEYLEVHHQEETADINGETVHQRVLYKMAADFLHLLSSHTSSV